MTKQQLLKELNKVDDDAEVFVESFYAYQYFKIIDIFNPTKKCLVLYFNAEKPVLE